MGSTHIQSRIVAPDPDTAAMMVREKLERQGYKIEKLTMWPCPVQPYPAIWIEWIAMVNQTKVS